MAQTRLRAVETLHKLICVEKLRNNIPREHLPQLNVNWINCAVKLYSWPLTFHKVVWQQIWGEVVVLIPASSADPAWI